MKKIIISLIACFVLLLGGIIVWDMAPIWAKALSIECRWLDMLAAAIFGSVILPSALFEQGRQELRAGDHDTLGA